MVTIREVNETDTAALSGFVNQLEHVTTRRELEERFNSIQQNSDYKTLAALHDTEIVGMVGLQKSCFMRLTRHSLWYLHGWSIKPFGKRELVECWSLLQKPGPGKLVRQRCF